MTTVLLADDDLLVLNRLHGLIDWNEHGFEIIGQTMDGKECIRLIQEKTPDILILDIDMPSRNGVEISRFMHDTNHPGKILILSNYDDYQFVRDSMKNGAFDYLLKHELNSELLLLRLTEIQKKIQDERKQTSNLSTLTLATRQNYLKQLCTSGITDDSYHSLMLHQPDFSPGIYCLVSMQITNFIVVTHFSSENSREKLISQVLTLSDNIFRSLGYGLSCYLSYGQFALFFRYPDSTSYQNAIFNTSSAMRLLLSNLKKLFGLTAFFEESTPFTSLESLPTLYKEVRHKLEKKPFSQENATSSTSMAARDNLLNMVEEKKLMDAMLSFDIPTTKQLLNIFFSRNFSDDKFLSETAAEQLLKIGNRFIQIHKDSFPSPINSFPTKPSGTPEFFLQYFELLISTANANDLNSFSLHVKSAIESIRKNYATNISLAQTAKALHVSHTHLSRIFRKETGVSFIDYLVSYRIEKAKELISCGKYELKEIADMTGFHSYNYFLRVYKEKTGRTPSQDGKGNISPTTAKQ